MTTNEVAALPTGTVVKCTTKFGDVFVAHKVASAIGSARAQWFSTQTLAPMDDFIVHLYNPEIIGTVS